MTFIGHRFVPHSTIHRRMAQKDARVQKETEMRISKTMPKGEARPLGSPKASRSALGQFQTRAKNVVDIDRAFEVDSPQSPIPARKDSMMTLTLKGLNKRSTQAIYVGARTTIRFSTSNFTDKIPPQKIDDLSVLLGPKAAKVRLTKAERAALPKPTLAERAARAEARAAKLRVQAEAERVSM